MPSQVCIDSTKSMTELRVLATSERSRPGTKGWKPLIAYLMMREVLDMVQRSDRTGYDAVLTASSHDGVAMTRSVLPA
jgi:hypothetical protein